MLPAITLFESHHCRHHSSWNLCLQQALQQSSIHTEHSSLFNSGWETNSIQQNGDGLLLMKFLFPLEQINQWPQNVCLKWYRVVVKQAVAEPAAAGNWDCMHCSQMCSHCLGQTCSNIQLIDTDSNEDIYI